MRRPRSFLTVAVTLSLAVAGLVLAPVASAAATFTFSMDINSSCVSGTGPASTAHTISLLSAGGDLLWRDWDTSDTYGNWYACFDRPIVPGDKVRAATGSGSRTVTVPNLTARANRVTDVVNGHAPAGAALNIYVYHYTALGGSSTSFVWGVFANGSGDYSFDFTPLVNAKGGDYGYTRYTSGSDTFEANFDFPYMEVARGSAEVSGALNYGQSATLTLKSSTNAVRGTALVVGDNGNGFDGAFTTAGGSSVRARMTDKVTGGFASDADITIPDIAVSAVASTDVVSGQCMANASYALYVRKNDYSDSDTRYGTTNASGQFSVDVTSTVNLASRDWLSLTCRYPSGDRVGVESRMS